MAWMDRALRRAGFRTLNLAYDSRRKPLGRLADDVGRVATRFAARGGPVHFVTHSMGGLVVRDYLDRGRPPWLGRVVMLGPPHRGSEFADLLHKRHLYRAFFGPAGQQLTTHYGRAALARRPPVAYPLGIIAGNRASDPLSALVMREASDGKVTVRSTMLAGMTDHLVVRVAHPWLVFDPTVIAQTIAFLRRGRFDRS